MSYSTGFGASDCAGASDAASDYNLADADMKSSCAKAMDLRVKINTLKPIVAEQKGTFASETTQEQAELFQARQAFPAAEAACTRDSNRRRGALAKFTELAAAGCYQAGGSPPPVVGPPVVAPPVVAPPKYAGPRYSISQCSATPGRSAFGQKGQSAFCWQRFLMAEGLSLAPYGADGDHGPITERASKEWEARQAPKTVVIVPAKGGGGGGGGKQTTASMMPKSILGLPTNYALAGAAALLVGGAFFYMKSQETER